MPHAQADPFLHQNEPSRESIICGKAGDWWRKRALIMLNLLHKTRQNGCAKYARMVNGTESTYAYDRQRE